MGGGSLLSSVPKFEEEEELLEFSQIPSTNSTTFRDMSSAKVEDYNVGEHGELFDSYDDDLAQKLFSKAPNFNYEAKRKTQVYKKILNAYHEMQPQHEQLAASKTDILSYRPGAWNEYEIDTNSFAYDLPTKTTLLLVGPKGSGKSSLVNKISRVLDGDKFSCYRAQVSYNNPAGGGTCFLSEYKMPRGATSFCLYDTRSLSENSSENYEMLKLWMSKGVRHGQLVVRNSDSSSLKTKMKYKARRALADNNKTRTVNFVIFVLNGLSLLRSMEGDNKAKLYIDMVAKTFNYPFLSFKDDKPVVVMTHGDLLKPSDRARVRLYLGELLGIPPMTQIFDIPETHDQVTEMEVVGMLRYCLERADRNLQQKFVFPRKEFAIYAAFMVLVFIALMCGKAD